MNLSCVDLCVDRGKQRVLENLSYDFQPGKLVGIVGPNGSGKSTLLRTLYGFLEPNSGSVKLDDKELGAWNPVDLSSQLGACPQEPEPTLDFQTEQLLSLRFGGDLKRTSERLEALEFLGLRELKDKRLSELSGGERQRVRLAVALSSDAPWLLLDEPANHLDLATGWMLFQYLVDQCKEGKGVVIALHNLQTALLHCRELLVLKNGKLVTHGIPSEVLSMETLGDVFGLRGKVIRTDDSQQLQLDGVVKAHD